MNFKIFLRQIEYGTFETELNVFCILLQAYEGHGVDYGSLNVIDRHKCIGRCPYLEGGFGWSRYGLIGGCVLLSEWTLRSHA